jgi:hypothetical protein
MARGKLLNMKYYKNSNNVVHAYKADGSQDRVIPGDLIAITESEANEITNPTPTLAALKVLLSDSVDSSISAIYDKFTRFSDEYREREAAARAFVAADYVGDPGPWVMGFATPAGKTAQQAADIIIAQADALKLALTKLGGLRMRKYEIKSEAVVNAELAQVIHDDIIALAAVAVAGL